MLSSSRTSASRCTAAARHTRQPLKVGRVRVPTHGGRHGIRSTTHALFTSTFGGIIMHPTGEPPNTSASTLCRSPCRRAVLLLHRIVLGDPCPLGSVDDGSRARWTPPPRGPRRDA